MISSKNTKMLNLFSEQTSTYLLLTIIFSIDKYLDNMDLYCNALLTFHLK